MLSTAAKMTSTKAGVEVIAVLLQPAGLPVELGPLTVPTELTVTLG